jgi:hypothetical protein
MPISTARIGHLKADPADDGEIARAGIAIAFGEVHQP